MSERRRKGWRLAYLVLVVLNMATLLLVPTAGVFTALSLAVALTGVWNQRKPCAVLWGCRVGVDEQITPGGVFGPLPPGTMILISGNSVVWDRKIG